MLDALAAPPDPGLDTAVGAGAAQRLRRELRAIARRWVAALAPGRAFEANSAGAASAALDGHAGRSCSSRPTSRGSPAPRRRGARRSRPTGIELSSAPRHDARPYLVALAANEPELIELAGGPLEALFRAAAERDLAMSMIRHERRLASAADARALALDPLSPPALVAQLGRLRPR